MTSYQLLDSGNGRKLERFDDVVLDRPCSQAVWRPSQRKAVWRDAHAAFTRETKDAFWTYRKRPEADWQVMIDGIRFGLKPTDFGHVGVFPEHRRAWQWIADSAESCAPQELEVLNLFAYSGGATLAAARAGFRVCHLDASKKMLQWARDNAALNGLQDAPIRWICDDVNKFLKREQRRGRRYAGIILDPPSFGRGTRHEIFKIDNNLRELLDDCRQLLSDDPRFVFLSCHTPGYTPIVLEHLLGQMLSRHEGQFATGEMALTGDGALAIPSGGFGAWIKTP
jgi:23S rRNA (cytosine1962-C5)-methyltransferase